MRWHIGITARENGTYLQSPSRPTDLLTYSKSVSQSTGLVLSKPVFRSSQPVQLQRLVRTLKLCMMQVWLLYFPYSKYQGAEQITHTGLRICGGQNKMVRGGVNQEQMLQNQGCQSRGQHDWVHWIPEPLKSFVTFVILSQILCCYVQKPPHIFLHKTVSKFFLSFL